MRWWCWRRMGNIAHPTVLAILLALPVQAETGCPMNAASFVDTTTGLVVAFRPATPWELAGMVKHVMEATLPDGRVLWGEITENMGVSRDEGRLYFGCARPGADDEPLSETALADCLAWEGVVYGATGGVIDFTPSAKEPAPETLIFADLGRQLRYAVMDGPEGEVWDQLVFSECKK